MSNSSYTKNSLGYIDLTVYGLSYLVPLTIFTTLGVSLKQSNNHLVFAYTTAMIMNSVSTIIDHWRRFVEKKYPAQNSGAKRT